MWISKPQIGYLDGVWKSTVWEATGWQATVWEATVWEATVNTQTAAERRQVMFCAKGAENTMIKVLNVQSAVE